MEIVSLLCRVISVRLEGSGQFVKYNCFILLTPPFSNFCEVEPLCVFECSLSFWGL